MHIRINLYICVIHTYIHSYYVIGRHENKFILWQSQKNDNSHTQPERDRAAYMPTNSNT